MLLPPGKVLVEETTVVLNDPGCVTVLLEVMSVVEAEELIAEGFELMVLVEIIVETLVVGGT